MISRKQVKVLKFIVDKLNKNQIPFQIHGGLAAIAYGAKRPLYDIDIDVYQKDLLKVKKLFAEYLVKDIHHEIDEDFDLYLMTFCVDGVNVDFDQIEETYYISKDGERTRMDPDLAKSKIMHIAGVNVPIEDKDELVRYKKIVGRDIDLIDIEQINNRL